MTKFEHAIIELGIADILRRQEQMRTMLGTFQPNFNTNYSGSQPGADLDRIEIVKMVRDNKGARPFNLAQDLDLLRQKIVEVGNVNLVQTDPITAYLGNKFGSYRTTAVYGVVDDGENKRKLLVKGKNNLARAKQ